MTTPKITLSPANQKKIQNLLSEAILQGDVSRVHKLLEQGADPSGRGGALGHTPLMDAASVFNRSLIEFFLPLNDVNATAKKGSTALSLFVKYLSSDVFCGTAPNVAINVPSGWKSSLDLLLSAGATEAEGLSSTLAATAAYWSSTSIEFSEIIQALPTSDFSAPDAHGCSPYIHALASHCARGGLRAATLLKMDPMRSSTLRSRSPRHGTLAHVAARHRRIDFLLEIAAEADFEARDSQGRTPLMAAMIPAISSISPFPCVDFFLRKIDPQATDHHGCDALMLLIEENQDLDGLLSDPKSKKTIGRLVAQSNLWARDFLGESSLDKARARNMHRLARLILRTRHTLAPSAPAPSSCSSAPMSPSDADRLQELLFRAIERNQITLVKKFLAQGACPRRRLPPAPHRIYDGRTPLITAAYSGNRAAAMIHYLAPLSNLLEVDAGGRTALLNFLHKTHISCDEDILALRSLFSPEVARIASHDDGTVLTVATANVNFWPTVINILSEGSDWMAIDAEGNNILARKLHHQSTPAGLQAIWNAHPDRAWLAASANHAGETIAHLAALYGRKHFLQKIAPQVDFSATTASGMTPLLLASLLFQDSIIGVSSIAAIILAPWSDCRVVDFNGCDALMLVVENTLLENDNLLRLVEALVGRVDLDARDFLGASALDKALCRNLPGTVAIIRSRMAIIFEQNELASIVGIEPQPSRSAGRRI